MKEYIEREIALKWQVPHYSANGVEIIEGKAIPVEYIENLPAADVVEVRCKDCKWRPRHMGEDVHVQNLDFPCDADGDEVCPYAAGDPWYNKEPNPNGFCHLGEEMNDNDN